MLALGCIALLMTWGVVNGQSSSVDARSCTYSFVVPDTNVDSSCGSYSSRQVEILQRTIEQLQRQVKDLSGGSNSSSSANTQDNHNPEFSCSCDANTTFAFTYRDCQDVKTLSGGPSGVYDIEPIRSTGRIIEVKRSQNAHDNSQRYWVTNTWGMIKVPCDMSDDTVGWTLLMRRKKFDVSFDRTWEEYKNGFGDSKTGDFWLGLENMHKITTQETAQYSLWIVLVSDRGVPHVYAYDRFWVGDEGSHYASHLEESSTGNIMSDFVSDRPFVTKDKMKKVPQNTLPTGGTQMNCAVQGKDSLQGGGWWFNGSGLKYSSSVYVYCGDTNLNAKQPQWDYFKGNITKVEMKIRPYQATSSKPRSFFGGFL